MALTAEYAANVVNGNVVQLFNEQYIVMSVFERETGVTMHLFEKLPENTTFVAREAVVTVHPDTKIHLYNM